MFMLSLLFIWWIFWILLFCFIELSIIQEILLFKTCIFQYRIWSRNINNFTNAGLLDSVHKCTFHLQWLQLTASFSKLQFHHICLRSVHLWEARFGLGARNLLIISWPLGSLLTHNAYSPHNWDKDALQGKCQHVALLLLPHEVLLAPLRIVGQVDQVIRHVGCIVLLYLHISIL